MNSSLPRIFFKKRGPNNGFTFLEILLGMAIFLIVAAIAGNFVITALRSISFGSEQEEAIINARRAAENISKDLREARNSVSGEYPLLTIEAQNLIWYGDIDNDDVAERIRYYLSGSNLYRTVIEPGPSNDYTGSSTTDRIASYVNNQSEPIFNYINDNNASTALINEVSLINIKLKINVTPERSPQDYYLETDVHLRNLKDNL